MMKNAQTDTERGHVSLRLQEPSARQRAPAPHAGSCSLLPVPRGAAGSHPARAKLHSLTNHRKNKTIS